MDKLNSKRIIITGGSLGIGFAIAKACVGQGAEVIIAARNQGNLEDSLKKIKNKKLIRKKIKKSSLLILIHLIFIQRG